MEEDIQNYSQTVMFRGTPCTSLTAESHPMFYFIQKSSPNQNLRQIGQWVPEL